MCKKQWLDAETVATQQRITFLLIVEAEGEHSHKLPNGSFAIANQRFQQHFSIAAGTKSFTTRCELFANLLKVVNLAVVNDAVAAGVIPKWLVTALIEINDGKTRVRKTDPGRVVNAGVIRPAMRNQCRELRKLLPRWLGAIRSDNSKNPAHGSCRQP